MKACICLRLIENKLTYLLTSLNIDQYPAKLKKVTLRNDRSKTRAVSNGTLIEEGKSILAKNTFLNDAIKAWNLLPDSIKNCKTLWSAKKATKNFVTTSPM